MENLKHTKGEWILNDEGLYFTVKAKLSSVDSVEVMYCPKQDKSIKGSDVINAQVSANAKLIAAAPDLLEALIKFTEMYKQAHDSGDWGNWDLKEDKEYQLAINAINKATV